MVFFCFLPFLQNVWVFGCWLLKCLAEFPGGFHDDYLWKQIAPLQKAPGAQFQEEFLLHAPGKGLVLRGCQRGKGGPAVCPTVLKKAKSVCLRHHPTKRCQSAVFFSSPVFCWRIWNLTGHCGRCSVKWLRKLVIKQSCHCKLCWSRVRCSSSFGAQTGLGLRQVVTVPPCC